MNPDMSGGRDAGERDLVGELGSSAAGAGKLGGSAMAVVASVLAALALAMLPAVQAGIALALGLVLLAIAESDRRQFIIPDALSLPLLPCGLLWGHGAANPELDIGRLAGMVIAGGGLWVLREAYFRARSRDGLGLGDVKLAAAAGAWVGWELVPTVLMVASLSGLVVVAVEAGVHRSLPSAQARLPFGIFLAGATWIVWFLDKAAPGLLRVVSL